VEVFDPVPPGVLEYPLVQYIPLPVRTLLEVAAPPALPGLAHLPDAAALARACSALGAAAPAWDGARITLLLAGATVGRCLYRAERAALLGAIRPGLIQILTVPRGRIYKDRVLFLLFAADGGVACRCEVTGARL